MRGQSINSLQSSRSDEEWNCKAHCRPYHPGQRRRSHLETSVVLTSLSFLTTRLTWEKTMETVVRAVDVGFGNTKYVIGGAGEDIRCSYFPSVAYPSARDLSALPSAERRKTVAVPINGLFYEVGPEVNLAA